MQIVDVWPDRAMYLPGESVTIFVHVHAGHASSATVALSIFHLDRPVTQLTRDVILTPGDTEISFVWAAPQAVPSGYGVEAVLLDALGNRIDNLATAFDVLAHWTTFPRYGFLSDFSPGRDDVERTIAALAQFHVNGLQFYDWQFRHDTLVPPTAEYVDPLGRTLSLPTIGAFIDAAHKQGMAAMPYLAIYGASADFWRGHLADALYDAEGQPIAFGEDFLGIMNPAPGGAWAAHLLHECMRTLAALPFDGLHVDQYGEPKVAFDAAGQPVDLPGAFVAFIAALKQVQPDATVLFNAVGDWPTPALATSAQDFAYIEIWPPRVTYQDVGQIVHRARVASGGKPVVIALYLPADRPANIRLADALIFSLGGTRIELGEYARLLADPYFPKHQALTSELRAILRRYYDFAVRYGEWLGPVSGAASATAVAAPAGVQTIVRRSSGWVTVSLINFCGLDAARWDEPHQEPTPCSDFGVRLPISESVHSVAWASPDATQPALAPVSWLVDDGMLQISVPSLRYWTMLAIELASKNA